MDTAVTTDTITVPDDASSLAERCGALDRPSLRRCGAPAVCRALFACPDCDASKAIPLCGFHRGYALRMDVVSRCHLTRMAPIAMEALR